MQTGLAKRITIFIDETDRWHGGSLASAIVDRLRKEGCAGATVMRGMVGFGVHGQVHTTAMVDLSVNLPIVITVVDDPQTIDKMIPILQEIVIEGLIVIDDVQAIRCTKEQKVATQAADPKSEAHHLVAEYLDAEPITVPPDMSVDEIVRVLLQHHRAYLPVVSPQRALLGVVSSNDLLAQIVHVPQGAFHFFTLRGQQKQNLGKDIKAMTASQVMRTPFPVVEPKTPMVKAVQIMLHERISVLPVTENNILVGILRLPDVLQKALSIENSTLQE